ncbi:MAG TPA: NAD-dependent protein deacetylase [Mycobacteriales bacterium]|nr:NAD-dependent protein deacetylase [Mycobacteriales bacterium]
MVVRATAAGQERQPRDPLSAARDLDTLTDLVAAGDVLVLSGAGISTESGIPDYRGPSSAARRASPMTGKTFTGDPVARRRYWARSHLGWGLIDRARPNDGHRAVAELQRHGLLTGVITQNVDGLHQAAGATEVIDLHGRLDRVRCLDCGCRTDRDELAARLDAANADWHATAAGINPDGDVELADGALDGFRLVDCTACAGVLKPDVVFFGETVPPERVEHCYDALARSRTLLVLGSSLTVMSGHRFVLRAARDGRPVAIVNQGATRGDRYAAVTVDAPLGAVLPALVARIAAPS